MLILVAAEAGLWAAGQILRAQWQGRNADSGISGPPAEGAGSALELWAFGDSYTVGIGAGEPARESYPAVAVTELSRALGRSVTLRNEAAPGLNSTEIVDRLEAALREGEGEPDWVVVLAGINNSRWLGQSGQFCLPDEPAFGPPWVLQVLRKSRVYRALRNGVLRLRPPRADDRACRKLAEGFQHLDEGLPDRAQAQFEEARELRPDSSWAPLGLALSHLRVGRHERAVTFFDQAEAGGLGPPALGLARGFSLRASGQNARARDAAKRAQKDDLAPFGRLLEAWLLWDEDAYEAALAHFDALAGLGEEGGTARMGSVVPYGWDGRGWTLRALGRTEEAASAFAEANRSGEAIHIAPHLLGWSHLGLALLAWESGEASTVEEELGLALRDSSTTPTAWALRGWLAAQADDCEVGGSWFAQALEIDPGAVLAASGQAFCASKQRLTAAPSTPSPPEAQASEDLRPPPLRPQVTISVQDWVDPGDTRLLRADLRRAASLAQERRVPLLVLGYPQPDAHPELTRAVAASADELGMPWLDPRPVFRQALEEGVRWEALLIPDGHPTTHGYALIGRQLAKALEESR